MNWFKQAQQDINQEYTQWIEQAPGAVNITGSGVGQTISIPGANQTINARDLLQKAVDLVRPQLLQHGVREIDTNPIPQGNAQGLAISHEPGKIHIDVQKIFNNFQQSLPPISQFDGIQADPDILNNYVMQISETILGEIGETILHEGYHTQDYRQMFQQGRPFTDVQESPAQQFGEQQRRQFFPRSLNY